MKLLKKARSHSQSTDATFNALGDAKWFSTLDLVGGYWQVEVKPSYQEKKTFIVPSGTSKILSL